METNSIHEFIDSFKLSSLGTLSPEDKLSETKRQYEKQLELAKNGDKNAISKVTKAFEAYALAAKDYYASSAPYQEIIRDGYQQLKQLAEHHKEQEDQNLGETGTKIRALMTERDTLLKLVYGMAIDAYKYDPSKPRNTATGENNGSISASLERVGINISNETIKKYLDQAKKSLSDSNM